MFSYCCLLLIILDTHCIQIDINTLSYWIYIYLFIYKYEYIYIYAVCVCEGNLCKSNWLYNCEGKPKCAAIMDYSEIPLLDVYCAGPKGIPGGTNG